ncbi:class I adenylate-forming enzyme family protein [Aldersonia kunmingensis]|uniref:class I adenylate-forming enzyme family protein n=1 Tax=Aldersonia kunmingensis TaxID=408066 RepID=UPI00082CA260|nr:AMP-binding protein [Aldersonia kunmingensis]
MALSVGSALKWWAATKPDERAIVVADETVTYRQLQDWTSRVARRIASAGIGPGQRVAVLSPNSVQWPVAALGVLKSGAVLVPLNSRLKGAELHKVITEAGVDLVLVATGFDDELDEAKRRGAEFGRISFEDIDALRNGDADDYRIDRDPDDPVALLFTSGSTGLPKGVICTNRTLLNIVFEASLTEEGLRPGSRTLLVLPLAFTPGLVWGLVMSIVLGGTIVVERELDPARAVRILERESIQAIFGVPLIFQALAGASEFADADLSSLRTAIVGGAAVPVPLLEAWAAKGVALRQIYGMTEAGGVATATLESESAQHPDTCGSGSIFTELKVVNAEGTECEPGAEGEILLRGPGVTPGYWEAPEATSQALRDGWLHSGDLGKRDPDGRLMFVDRLKDLIISGGINISPVEIESVISGFGGVEEVVVIAAKDSRFGETPAAIVTAAGELGAESIIAGCAEVLADYKVPRYVVVRDEPLPRLPSGKLDKARIRVEYDDVADRFEKVR